MTGQSVGGPVAVPPASGGDPRIHTQTRGDRDPSAHSRTPGLGCPRCDTGQLETDRGRYTLTCSECRRVFTDPAALEQRRRR